MCKQEIINTIEMKENDRILKHLEDVCNHPSIATSHIMRRFLNFIVHETLSGRKNMIKEYTIAINVLNKPTNFVPQNDAIVRIHAGRLRSALKSYYSTSEGKYDIMITIPKGAYIPVFAPIRREPDRIHREKESGQQLNFKTKIIIIPFLTLEKDLFRRTVSVSIGTHLCKKLSKLQGISCITGNTLERHLPERKPFQTTDPILSSIYIITGDVYFERAKMRILVRLLEKNGESCLWKKSYHMNFLFEDIFCITKSILKDLINIILVLRIENKPGIVKQINEPATLNGRNKNTIYSAVENFSCEKA